MLFNSPLFLFLFLPLVAALYFLSGNRLRNPIALLASLLFYAWAEPRFILIVLASALLDYALGLLLSRGGVSPLARRTALTLGVLSNLAVLLYFKYTAFLLTTLSAALTALHFSPLSIPTILLPIGVSFIVFEKITYLVDLYRRTGHPARTLPTYLLYVFFFPKLLAGPIIKYHDIDRQLQNRTISLEDLAAGLTRFSLGLWKKVFLADTLGRVVDPIFRFSPSQLGFAHAWLGILAFSLQIYFDFSGYSDMAIGLARILGFHLRENFNHPYISQSFTEFWRRWHISLSTWIREYLYIPLGGNRVSTLRTYFNLWLCFLLSGLWHGAKWTFVLWGVYQGFFLLLDRLSWLRLSTRLPKVLNIPLTFVLLLFGWILFRADTLSQAVWYTQALFSPHRPGAFLYLTNDVYVFLSLGLLLSFLPAFTRARPPIEAPPLPPAAPLAPSLPPTWQLVLAVPLLVWSAARIAGSSFTPFLYFRF